jgi:murein hydrolase activator
MSTVSRYILIVPLLLALVIPARAQTEDRQETERRLETLKGQIEQDQRRLSQTAEAERTTMETLRNVERQIALREELVRNYRLRMDELSQQSDSIQRSMRALEAEVARQRTDYQRRAIHAYKYGRMHDLALILSAQSINQMIVRARYLRQFADQRRKRLQEIAGATATLENRREELHETRSRSEQLLAEAEDEQRNLSRLRQEQTSVVAQLRTQRATVERELENKRSAARQLENRIQQLIAAEASRRREREAVDPTAAASYIELSGSFTQNRGHLPWPAEGVVTEPFGDLVNPIYGTVTPNPGILIATRSSAEVRTVFDGEIISVSVLPDFGTYIMIEHGDYLSVYSNFSMLYVGEGERVRTGQVIGRAGTEAEPKGAGVFFALFKKGQERPLDPSPWLVRR